MKITYFFFIKKIDKIETMYEFKLVYFLDILYTYD